MDRLVQTRLAIFRHVVHFGAVVARVSIGILVDVAAVRTVLAVVRLVRHWCAVAARGLNRTGGGLLDVVAVPAVFAIFALGLHLRAIAVRLVASSPVRFAVTCYACASVSTKVV